jgi:hypothetical protein
MTARLRIRDDTNTLRTIDGTGSTRIRMRDSGNTLRTLTRIRMRDPDNVLRVVYDVSGASSFSASASPTGIAGHTAGTTITTRITTVTATGGTPPYTYAWTKLSWTNATPPTINSPAAAATTATQTNCSDVDNATIRCTVSDSASNHATADVACTWVNIT